MKRDSQTKMALMYGLLCALGVFFAVTALGADDYSKYTKGIEAPCEHFSTITLSDSVDLDHATRQVKFATAGNVKVTTVGGETTTIYGIQNGEVLTGRFTRIWSTGTTATAHPPGSETTDITVGW